VPDLEPDRAAGVHTGGEGNRRARRPRRSDTRRASARPRERRGLHGAIGRSRGSCRRGRSGGGWRSRRPAQLPYRPGHLAAPAGISTGGAHAARGPGRSRRAGCADPSRCDRRDLRLRDEPGPDVRAAFLAGAQPADRRGPARDAGSRRRRPGEQQTDRTQGDAEQSPDNRRPPSPARHPGGGRRKHGRTDDEQWRERAWLQDEMALLVGATAGARILARPADGRPRHRMIRRCMVRARTEIRPRDRLPRSVKC
jgi:hypothetical protein